VRILSRKMDLLAAAFFFFLIISSSYLRGADFELGGYLKDFQVGFAPPGYADRLGLGNDLYGANFHTLRLEAGAGFSSVPLIPGELKLFAAYSLSAGVADRDFSRFLAGRGSAPDYRIDDLRPRLYPGPGREPESFSLGQNIDRFYLAWSGPLDIYLGRQPFGWGAARTINPTDVLVPFRFDELDKEERVGLDAARAIYPLGMMSEVDAGIILGEDGESENSAGYLRGRTYLRKTDISATVMAYRENLLAGFDLARSVGGSGVWVEAAWNRVEKERMKEEFYRVVAGWDRSFLKARLYTYLEYHYNGAGAEEAAGYYSNFERNPAYSQTGVFLLGRHYLLPSARWQFTPLVTGGGLLFINLADGSVLVSPTVEYNAAENFYVGGGGYLGFGKSSTDPASSESEFGDYGRLLYVSMRYYF